MSLRVVSGSVEQSGHDSSTFARPGSCETSSREQRDDVRDTEAQEEGRIVSRVQSDDDGWSENLVNQSFISGQLEMCNDTIICNNDEHARKNEKKKSNKMKEGSGPERGGVHCTS